MDGYISLKSVQRVGEEDGFRGAMQGKELSTGKGGYCVKMEDRLDGKKECAFSFGFKVQH